MPVPFGSQMAVTASLSVKIADTLSTLKRSVIMMLSICKESEKCDYL